MTEVEQLRQEVERLTKENQQLKRVVFDILEYNEKAIANISDPVENFKQFNSRMNKIVSSTIKLND